MTNYQELSENELKTVIDNAEKALKRKQESKRKEIIAQIYELAASIDVKVEIKELDRRSARKGMKVAIKYMNPDSADEKWTGRGMQPKWLRELIASGRDISEFEVNS